MERKMNKFWMVWREGTYPPQKKHDTKNSAKVEAARLAMQHPDIDFTVLESIGGYRKPTVFWTPHEEPK
ncbi:MAG TPA: hypothetical protein ENI13_00220 [candidate division CPR3 bacterium]|uniref:DUF2188 domain-containing protein n=1 Tax=candidate division CPR3 bacterium TaxID=2268181 RepID=A0A7C1NZ79_UNCC3|nr:hypothetical protein [candidate division CPR3 bacterium]